MNASIIKNTHIVTLGGEAVECHAGTFQDVCDDLVRRHGGGIPKVTTIQSVVTAPSEARVVSTPTREGVSETGRERAARDEIRALENGFAPRDPVFQLGTRVNEVGVENATRSQLDHEAKPFATDVCSAMVAQVRAEERRDLDPIRLSRIRMADSGELMLPGGETLTMTDRIFTTLMGRFPCASGTAYLNDCPTVLRAYNFNYWAGATDRESRDVVLRTRKMGGRRAAYAAVSSHYTSFDADVIAEALSMAFPSDARGVGDYDGERLRVEGMWHTDIAPNEFVAGEIFKAGVIVRSDDTGAGSIRVQSVIWRNLCQNLIILDKAIGVDVRLRHKGSVQSLAFQFRKAFGQALSSVNPFRLAWTAAMAERDRDFVRLVQGTTREDITSLPAVSVLPGVFNGILQRELVPVRGRKEEIVPKLLEMHSQDEVAGVYGVSRASIVNAFTRYAHVVESDPWAADRIREGAGALLSGHKGGAPAPLPYVALA
jgi:hypothetical protein